MTPDILCITAYRETRTATIYD